MDLTLQREPAQLLATLRREGRQQSGLDARLVPPDEHTAYRVAQMVAEELDWPIAGWKIAAMKEEMQKALRTDSPIYGRVFAPMVMASPLSVVHAKLCSPIPEAEYMARLGSDLPPRSEPYTVEEVTEAVGSLHPGLELAECRFIHDAAFPALPAILADGAGGTRRSTIGGAARSQASKSYSSATESRGAQVPAASAIDNPMVPLTWLANELSRTSIGLQAGQMISTGTLTGMLAPKPGETYVADFGPFGSVTVSFT